MMKNKEKKVLAVDIGGTSIKVALVDQNGKINFIGTEKTNHFSNPQEIPNYIQEKLNFLNLNNTEIIGVGIGAPNGNTLNGHIEFAPNLPWKGSIPLTSYFENYFKVKAILANDANAAALGEKLYGNKGDKNNFILITLGTGLGSGIVINGNLIIGHDGLAGEIGHLISIPNGRECGCGRKGCLETYCSATGLVKTYQEIKSHKSEEFLEAKFIYQKAIEGEKEAIKAFEITGEILGFALANCVTFSSPKSIFLFGGLAQAGDLLLEPTIKSFNTNLLKIYQGKTEILISTLPKNDAAFLGAASLIWNENLN